MQFLKTSQFGHATSSAKNFAGQAEKALTSYAASLKDESLKADRIGVQENLIKPIRSATHFVLPDGSSLFNQEKQPPLVIQSRLPHPNITIEYFTDENTEVLGVGEVSATKRLIVAKEVHVSELLQRTDLTGSSNHLDIFEYWVSISAASFYPKQNKWLPISIGWLLPVLNSSPTNIDWITKAKNSLFAPGIKEGIPFDVSPTVAQRFFDKQGIETALTNLTNAIIPEVRAVVELVECLKCANVSIQSLHPTDAKTNERRVRSGKVPVYETQTLLMSNSPLLKGEPRVGKSGLSVWINSSN